VLDQVESLDPCKEAGKVARLLERASRLKEFSSKGYREELLERLRNEQLNVGE
jgi:hypothetical protein